MMKNKKSSKKKSKLWKKVLRSVFSFFAYIYRVIDRFIITPIAKFMMAIMRVLNANNKPLERLLNNRMFLITLSLALALISFFSVDKIANTMMNDSADVIYGKEVKALYNEEAYVVEGLEKTVDITLIGRRADLYLANQYQKDEVVVDLRGLKPGTHRVALKYKSSVASIDYKIDPSYANVTIYEKVSESRKVTKEILYEDKLDSRYSITNTSFSRDDVYIKGAEYKLQQVAMVKALLDVTNIINPSVGTTTLKDIPLVAYDKNGNKMDVEIVPKTVDATIEIASPSKEVPIKVIPEGDVVFGKSIDSITVSETNVKLFGDMDVLSKIDYLPVSINVDGISKATEYNVNLSLPSGVNEASTKSVVVKVSLGDTKSKTIDDVSIATKNLGSGLVAKADGKANSKVSVVLKGTNSNIKAVTTDAISAYVDLNGLGVGTHEVTVKVTGDDLKIGYTPTTKTVKIIITKEK